MTWVHIVRPHEIFSTMAIIILSYYMWKMYVSLRPNAGMALEGMSDALNKKSPYYADHSKRVALIANAICDSMNIIGTERNIIIRSAKLHDLGKLFVDEETLHKKEKLTDREWEIMKLHPVRGGGMAKKFGISEPVIANILYHHENVDGTGYPLSLKGESIPLGAKIIRVADTIDAMAMPRPYRKARSFEEIEKDLKEHIGTWYDKTIVEKATNGLSKRIKLIILNNTFIGTEASTL